MSVVPFPASGARGAPETFVEAEPYPWPFDGALHPGNTALVIIDMQTDFCGPGGYVDAMGYDLGLTRAPIAPIGRLLAAARARGYHVITPARDTGRTSPTCPRTSAGAPAGSGLASAIPAPAGASWCGGSPAGRSSRNWRPCPANR